MPFPGYPIAVGKTNETLSSNDHPAHHNVLGGAVNYLQDQLTGLSGGENVQVASYMLILSDGGKIVTMDVAGANTLTVPTNAAVAFPIGTIIGIYQKGAGATTVQGDTGVVVVNAGGVGGQGAMASLWKRGTNEWVLTA